MLSQGTKLNTESLYSPDRTDSRRQNIINNEKSAAGKTAVKDPEDILTISRGGDVRLSMFNYLDNGKADLKGTPDGQKKEVSITIKPNFLNVTSTRYAQMKAEIEKKFANDPAAKSKYLNELDRALDDYVNTQTKVIAHLSTGKKEENEKPNGNSENKTKDDNDRSDTAVKTDTQNDSEARSKDEKRESVYNKLDSTVKKYINVFKGNNEKLGVKESLEKAESTIADEEVRKLLRLDDADTKIMIEKIFGEQENDYSPEVSKVIDELFSRELKQETIGLVAGKKNGAREVKLKFSAGREEELSRSDIIDKILLTRPNRTEFKDPRINY